MLSVKKLSFQHHKKAPFFFKNLSFELAPGKIHALHGKNGTGKTILLHLLCGNIPKESILDGEILSKNPQLVNQKFDLMIADQFTARENLQFGQMPLLPSMMKRPFFNQKFPELFERFQINPDLPTYLLSGGQRQILALSMKLQKRCSVLLLDEPTATLDEQNAALVFEFLQTLKEMTILAVCHDKDLIYKHTSGQHLHIEKDISGLRVIRQE